MTALICLDRSATAHDWLAVAAQRTAAHDHVIVLQVLEIPENYLTVPHYAHALDAARSQLRREVLGIPALAARSHETHVLAGKPAQRILEVAEVRGVQAIVLGTHGPGRVRAVLCSRVTPGVLHGATCPVTIIPGCACEVSAPTGRVHA